MPFEIKWDEVKPIKLFGAISHILTLVKCQVLYANIRQTFFNRSKLTQFLNFSMASILTCHIFFLYLNVFSALVTTISGKFTDQSPMIISSKRMEKMTDLHFYHHDIVTGKNPTAMRIAGPQQGFGATVMMDDPLTEEVELTSKLLGRAQGIYARASHEEANLLMVFNFVFVEGIYNGSSISILGHNPIFHKVRELPVVGGSGIFRFARGYALATTVLYDQNTRSAVVEYNVSVLHF